MNQSINYFFQEIPGVASDNCKLYFDFLSGANPQVVYNKSGDLNITGSIFTGINSLFSSGFWDYNDSAYFNSGKYVKINNTTGINIQNFTACFVYRNLKNGGSTLISTVNTGTVQSYTEEGNVVNNNVYKGFDFGITANNYLYFEYYTDNGPTIFLSENNLSEKNSIFLSITNNSLAFGYYDFFKESLISYNYNINNYFLHDTNEIFLGYNPRATGTYAFNSLFTGYIDELLIFSPSIYNYEIVNVNSGFAHIFDSGAYYQIIENLVTGITGYQTGIVGYQNKVTGKGLIATNRLTGKFGEIYSGYTEYTLTGLVPYVGLIGLTGNISFDISSGYSGTQVIKNSGYIESFGKNYINFVYENTQEDLIEINLTTNYSPELLKNIELEYLLNSQSFVPKENLNLNNNYTIYTNGQLHQIGSFYFTGNGYRSGKYIINDYIIDKTSISFANKYNQDDSVIADYIVSYDTGLYIDNFSVPTGVGNVTLGWGDNTNVYFNGQKLTENLDYTISATPTFYFSQKLTGDNGLDLWGNSVATNNDGSIVVIGGDGDNNSSGAAIVYTGSAAGGWVQKQKLTGDSGADFWGYSVATNNNGNVIVLGGYADNSYSGAVIVYTGSAAAGWIYKQKLTGDNGTDVWGSSITTNNDGSIVVIGGYQDNNYSGAAIVYTGSASLGWRYKQKLTGDTGQDRWANSVVTNGDGSVVILGSYLDNTYSGAVIVYTGSAAAGWIYKQKLTGDNGQDYWGQSVTTNNDGSVVILGGIQDNNGSGAAIVYTGSAAGGWVQKQKLTGDNGIDLWGHSVTTNNDGSVIVLGGYFDNNQSGAAIIYTGSSVAGWTYKQKLTGDTGQDYWGQSVDTNNDGSIVVIGGSQDNNSSGAATIYISKKDIIFNQNSYKYTGVSGKLIGIDKSSDLTITGSGNLFNVNFYSFSEIYKNGVRQVLNNDYLELASIDSNTGKRFFDQKSDIIYNNNTL